MNIIKGGVETSVDAALFEEESERELFEATQKTQTEVLARIADGDYAAALGAIATLRGPVDAFFEGVMVMAKEETVRTNRLALLTQVARLFAGIADFSRIA